MFNDFMTLPVIIVSAIVVGVILLFGISAGIIKLINRSQRKKRDRSLPPGESAESDYAEFLAEKYQAE